MRRSSQSNSARPRLIQKSLLKAWPLPGLNQEGDKELRGRVLIIAGSEGMPGAAILAATAALRAGAGKLQIAVPKSVAAWVAMAVPEALVISLPGTSSSIAPAASAKILKPKVAAADAILIGPGMTGDRAVTALVKLLLPALKEKTVLLDAAALHSVKVLRKRFVRLGIQAMITPHAGEMATLLDQEKSTIQKDSAKKAREFARDSGIVIALKGSETFIASPDGTLHVNKAGNVGLGVSGSGDTLAGIIAGLAARGASPTQATVWGVHLHACAGDILAKRIGRLGYLPRELLAEIPKLLEVFAPRRSKR